MKRCVFNRLNIGMIPLSYKESLTYEEQILWMQKNLNDAIDLLNQLKEAFDNIDLNFDELEHEISLIKTDIYQINNKITNLEDTKADKSEVESELNALDQSLKEIINSEYSILKAYTDQHIEDLQYQIDHIDVDNIKVLDPTTGTESTIQEALVNVYNVGRTDSISAGEFDSLELTAGEFDAKEISAFNFDQHSKSLLTE
jgi:predicted  nucleic acid-binding Zn-ribbon protein